MQFIAGNERGWPGKIAYVENLGSDTFAYIDVGADDLMTMRLSGKTHPRPGENVRIGPNGCEYHLFDAKGIVVERKK